MSMHTLKEIWFWTLLILFNFVGLDGILTLFTYPNTAVFLSGFVAVLLQITANRMVISLRYKKKVVEQ